MRKNRKISIGRLFGEPLAKGDLQRALELLYLTRFSSSSCRKRRLPKMATKPATMKLMSNSDRATSCTSNIIARQIAKPAIIKKIMTKDFSIAAKLTKGSRHRLICFVFDSLVPLRYKFYY
jgi:hypothetical protein